MDTKIFLPDIWLGTPITFTNVVGHSYPIAVLCFIVFHWWFGWKNLITIN